MFKLCKKELNWGGKKLTLETGKIARQADGAVLVTYGDTMVLCTAVAKREMANDVGFFPLTVQYQEKAFAAGRIPGGFFKREGKPSEHETLVSRLIDRPIRPLFAPTFRNDTQIICTVLSHDMENAPDIPALIGASAALTISGLPFFGPIGAARVGFINDTFVLNPTSTQISDSKLNLVVAGTSEGVLMVESEAHELSEPQMLEAVMFGHAQFQAVVDAIVELAEECAKEPWELPPQDPQGAKLIERLKELAIDDLKKAYQVKEKGARHQKLGLLKTQTVEALKEEGFSDSLAITEFKELEKEFVRSEILKTGLRIDGRDTKTIRPILSEVGILPRAHGSALFTRGSTQALVVATLGTGQDEQVIDALEGEYKQNFLLHYNFPPFSVGETGRMSGPGRREIGHGKLAWRALHPLLPSKEKFPYTIRLVSEITESDGSSSMASVCGGSLALMVAGAPLERPVAGIAMGLIKSGTDFAVLSDIIGDEDHLGDMDFKVAGSEQGITALQMDLKITSITRNIMEIALEQARVGRLHILGKMAEAIGHAREEVGEYAPRMITFTIPKDKIREVIGAGGKVIRELCETTGAKIDISDDGTLTISGANAEVIAAAEKRVRSITDEPVIGMIYKGKVVRIVDFGAFVNFFGSQDGLVHISELAPRRVEKVNEVVKVDDEVFVKVLDMDARGKIRLSMKQVDQKSGKALSSEGNHVVSED
jgi:polyribonucleotide nucleotidyltransferase